MHIHTHTLFWDYRSDIILEKHFRCLDDKWTNSWQAPLTHSVVGPNVLFSDTQEGLQRSLAAWDKNTMHSRSHYRRRAQSQGSVLHHSNHRQDKDAVCLGIIWVGIEIMNHHIQHGMPTNTHAHCVLLKKKNSICTSKTKCSFICIFWYIYAHQDCIYLTENAIKALIF